MRRWLEKFLNEIIKIIEEHNIDEIEIKRFFTSIRIVKQRKSEQTITVPVMKEEKEEKIKEEKGYLFVKAPLVGTFYRSPSPGMPPYVDVGDKVTPGKIVGIIEAMKVMNEIESDVSGTIVEVLVKNGEPVEYAQPLFKVIPE